MLHARSLLGAALAVVVASFGTSAAAQNSDPANCDLVKVLDASGPEKAADDSLNCLLRKIERLERELRPFRMAKGAVIAFDRSEDTSDDNSKGSCPEGWSLFREAGGRMILGAGEHSNEGITKYPSFMDNPSIATGGEEKVTLSESQLPRHTHSFDFWFSNNDGTRGNFDPAQAARIRTGLNTSGRWTHQSDRSPIGAAGVRRNSHNNMPPYIALYFCKKD